MKKLSQLNQALMSIFVFLALHCHDMDMDMSISPYPKPIPQANIFEEPTCVDKAYLAQRDFTKNVMKSTKRILGDRRFGRFAAQVLPENVKLDASFDAEKNSATVNGIMLFYSIDF